MSISTLQEKFFNKGCGSALIVIAAVAMGASLFSQFGRGSNSNGPDNGGSGATLATIGGVPVPATEFQQLADRAQQYAGSTGDPTAKVMSLVQAATVAAREAAIQSLLAKEAVTADDVSAAVSEKLDAELQSMRDQMTRDGKLKPGASEADFEKAMQTQLKGKSIAAARDEAVKGFVARFNDPKTKDAVIQQLGTDILAARLGSKSLGSDEDLRQSYDTYITRRIYFSDTSGSKETAQARAEKALAALKSGTSFETLMDTVSNDAHRPGKPAHSSTDAIPASQMASQPQAELKGKPAMTTTGIITVPGGKAIYQLLSVSTNLPPDFDKNKAKYRAQKAATAGAALRDDAIKALLNGSAANWTSAGFHALVAVGEALPQGFSLDPKAMKEAIAVASTAAKSSNAEDKRLGVQALLLATDPKVNPLAKPEDLAADRLSALETARSMDLLDSNLLIELAKIYADHKDAAKATDALIAASKANQDYGPAGQKAFGDVAATANDLQTKGAITKDQLTSIQTQQGLYTAARSNAAKAETSSKATDEQIRKANEAELERQKAEAAKGGAGGSGTATSDAALKKANDAEIARQKAEAERKPSPGAPTPTAPAGKSPVKP